MDLIQINHLSELGQLFGGQHWKARLGKAINLDRRRFNDYLKSNRPIPIGVFAESIIALEQVNITRFQYITILTEALTKEPFDLKNFDESMFPYFKDICISLFGNEFEEPLGHILHLNPNYAKAKIDDFVDGTKPIYLKLWKILLDLLIERTKSSVVFIEKMLIEYPEVYSIYLERK